MIPHKITSKRKTKNGFKNLVNYLTKINKGKILLDNKFNNIGVVEYNDCIYTYKWNGVSSIKNAALEMNLVAEKNVRVNDPIYHLSISWRENENPENDVMFKCGLEILRALGVENHQYVMAIHKDTNNHHIQLCFNKINPITYKSANLSKDFYKMNRACRELELKYGFEVDNGSSIYDKDNKTIRDKSKHEQDEFNKNKTYKQKTSQSVYMLEKHRGIVSFASYLDKNIKAILNDYINNTNINNNWDELHKLLADYGVGIWIRNNGLVFYDLIVKENKIKLSAIDNNFSKSKFEKILGEFKKPSNYKNINPFINKDLKSVYSVNEYNEKVESRKEMIEFRKKSKAIIKKEYKQYMRDFYQKKVGMQSSLEIKKKLIDFYQDQIKDINNRLELIESDPAYIKKYEAELDKIKIKHKEVISSYNAILSDISKINHKQRKPMNYESWLITQLSQLNSSDKTLTDHAYLSELRSVHYIKTRNKKKSINNNEIDDLKQLQTENPITFIFNSITLEYGEDNIIDSSILINKKLSYSILESGAVVYYTNNSQSIKDPLFIDYGNKINILNHLSYKNMKLEFELFVIYTCQKFQKSITINGSDDFVNDFIRVCAEKGIKLPLTNEKHQELMKTAINSERHKKQNKNTPGMKN